MSHADKDSLVVLDTETTGLSAQVDRIIEIGCIKMRHRRPVEKFHTFLKVDKAVSAEAVKVHGITNAMLADKPVFSDVMDDFLAFVADSALVIHNAAFDMGFLEAELARAGCRVVLSDLCPVIDTLMLARKRYPGQKNNLDALCKRFGIDISHRQAHGALKDADLLVKVYLQLTTEQVDMNLAVNEAVQVSDGFSWPSDGGVQLASDEAVSVHEDFLKSIQSDD